MVDEKKTYELAFMARDEKGIGDLTSRIKDAGGEVVLEGPVEQMQLAYPIKKQTQGHFGYLHVKLDADKVNPLMEGLEHAQGILRALIITPVVGKQKPRQMPMGDKARSTTPGTSARPMAAEKKPAAPAAPAPLSNEALEKKIEEILQQS